MCRSGSRTANWELYPKALSEMARVCRPHSGRAVLLTHDNKALSKVHTLMHMHATHTHTYMHTCTHTHTHTECSKRCVLEEDQDIVGQCWWFRSCTLHLAS